MDTSQRVDGSSLDRNWRLMEAFRVSQLSRRHGVTHQSLEQRLSELLGLLVPNFCDWCVIEPTSGSQQLLRHVDCFGDNGASHSTRCRIDGVQFEEALSVAGLSKARNERRQQGALKGGATFIAADLLAGDQRVASVTCVATVGSAPLDEASLVALRQVLWILGEIVDHDLLQQLNRTTVRQTQSIARQLHQLIAASIAVARATSEQEILTSLAASVRSVFDGDVATVATVSTSLGRMSSVARRGRSVRIEASDDATFFQGIAASERRTEPWAHDQWLVAPMLSERREVIGVVAVQRPGREFSGEDREVATLLSQMAATALSASELGRAIAASEERQRVLLETAPIGIVEVGAHGRVKYWNLAASRIFGWSTYEDAAGQATPEFPDSISGELNEVWRGAKGGSLVEPRDVLGLAVAGRARVLSIAAAPLPSADGSLSGVLTLVDDVTNQRELKAEIRHAQTMEMRGQIASRIAHDFNNLLTLITGYSEMLIKDLAFDDRLSHMAKDIQATASRASLLTGQLQSIGRTKVASPVVMDPAAVMQSNAEVLERILGSSVKVAWNLDNGTHFLRADADQFEQMILNLSMNARDAMPEGGQLSFSVSAHELGPDDAGALGIAPGPYVRVSVSDTGVGMDAETQAQCFEPLFTTKGPFKGTGMGLASARRLMEESSGAIRCTSALGEGTTFDMFFPAVDGPRESTTALVEESRGTSGEHILVAEDDESLRRLVIQVLRRNGYRVDEVASAEDAIVAIRQMSAPADLLITDVVMGAMTGRELADTVHHESPAIRILMMSGTADRSILDGLDPQRVAFLAKPFRPSALIDAVHELLGRAS